MYATKKQTKIEKINSMKKKMPKRAESIKPIIDEFKNELVKLYGTNLKQLILFGSFARGTFNIESDIDILLVLNTLTDSYAETDRVADLKFDFMLKHNRVISCLFSDTVKFNKQSEPIYYNIQKEGVLL